MPLDTPLIEFITPSRTNQPYSLGRRLLLLLVGATLLVWLLSSVSIYVVVKDEAQEILDHALVETALALLVISPLQPTRPKTQPSIAFQAPVTRAVASPALERVVFQVWRRDGQLIYRSGSVSTQPLLPLQATPQPASFDWISRQGEQFRSYSVWDTQQQIQVQIAERDDIRQQIFDETAAHLLTIAAVCLPLLIFLIFWLIRISLKPLQHLTENISTQSIEQLQVISTAQTPLEIKPLVDALNHLLSQITNSIERERRFTANAAHELRTPLAAIRLHAQVLQGARNPAEADEAALDIQQGVDRCTRLIEQLLVLARLDPQQISSDQQQVDLATCIETVVAQHHYLLDQQQIHLHVDTVTTHIWGNPDQMQILLRNLLDNAIRYRGAGDQIWLSCGRNDEQQVYLSIEDQGVGIAAEQHDKIFDRFYRLADATSTGSGLGLSIVWQIAQLHRIRIQLSTGRQQRGTRFTLFFPADRPIA